MDPVDCVTMMAGGRLPLNAVARVATTVAYPAIGFAALHLRLPALSSSTNFGIDRTLMQDDVQQKYECRYVRKNNNAPAVIAQRTSRLFWHNDNLHIVFSNVFSEGLVFFKTQPLNVCALNGYVR